MPSTPASRLASRLVSRPASRLLLSFARPHSLRPVLPPIQSLATISSRPRFAIPRPRRPSASPPRPDKDAYEVALQSDQEAVDGNDDTANHEEETAAERDRDPPDAAYYQLSFTCIPCDHRSHHSVSKHGYHFGSVLITCPGCRNRHIISDHLKVFGDRDVTVEDLMRERGRLVKRGTLGEDGDVEFWPEELLEAGGASQTSTKTQSESRPRDTESPTH
ncbi:hypothetical protein XA68_15517 [Ophiocordyceps unilateralis]|uniref:DNL-type domain-containing protein n=1 Tax=Ophiocordyceps unilateralis TaxID=268505 RepID=A0A2A9P8A3_OPHUN|nr:hypothetical protein XA68_15517 [Ophiocordyceps unilateralis]